MKIVVFGANGRVGSLLVKELLDAGHEVRAFVHGSADMLPQSERVTIIQGDIYNQTDVADVVAGCDVVASCLGSWGSKRKDILTEGMKNIIPAMNAANTKRIVSLTGAAAFDATESSGLVDRTNRWLLSLVAPKILSDGETHLALLRTSGLNWTVLRSPVMRKNGREGYELNLKFPAPWATIHRGDVVRAMRVLIESDEFSSSAPFIHRS